jgi:hypothetical protein
LQNLARQAIFLHYSGRDAEKTISSAVAWIEIGMPDSRDRSSV